MPQFLQLPAGMSIPAAVGCLVCRNDLYLLLSSPLNTEVIWVECRWLYERNPWIIILSISPPGVKASREDAVEVNNKELLLPETFLVEKS